ncbi:MAG: hypothetical protein ACK4SY_09580 [Pyrobaculum sp.]
MELGWIAAGAWGLRNAQNGPLVATAYSTTVGNKSYTTICGETVCRREVEEAREKEELVMRLIGERPPKAEIVGRCRHLGRGGEIIRVSELSPLLAEVVRQAAGELDIAMFICLRGDLPLWAGGEIGGAVSIRYWLNAIHIGDYNETRYREVLRIAKEVFYTRLPTPKAWAPSSTFRYVIAPVTHQTHLVTRLPPMPP